MMQWYKTCKPYHLVVVFLLSLSCAEAKELVFKRYPIAFSGYHLIEKSQLEEALSVENKSFFEFWKVDNPRIKEKLLPTLVDTLRHFYISEGFYDAKVEMEFDSSRVHVRIEEHEPVRVERVVVESDYDIADYVAFKKGDIFRAKAFMQSKSKIVASLLKDGYCSYDLDTKAYVDVEKHQVDVRYLLSKGDVCHFGALVTSGLHTIDEEVIKSRVRAVEGERFSTLLVQKTLSNLYALGAFDSVLIDVDKKIYNVIPVAIAFKEIAKPYHLEFGIGYDTYVGPRVHTQWTKYNFLGNAQKLNLNFAWSKLEQLAIADYQKPAFVTLFGHSVDLGVRLGYSNLEFDGFQEEKSFLDTHVMYRHDRLSLQVGMAFEVINIDALDNLDETEELQQAVNEGEFVLTYPYVDIVYDARDSKLNPKYGYYLAAYTEIGLANDEGSALYNKTELEARLIHTFSNLTLSAVGKVGVLDEESGKGLPESKYFFGGGSYSNRAYGYREMGVIASPTEDTIYGASSMLNLSLEANYPLWKELYGAVFTDNTLLNEEAYDFSGEVISSVGVGVRYMTPIGPFKIDVGFNVHDPSIYGISFQIGQSF